MAYPQTDSPRTELLINGTWTDVSSYVRGEQGTTGIQITRGRAQAQSAVQAQTSNFKLENIDGRFSNRNPTSPYYGLLPRNTQIRHQAGAATSADTYMWTPYNDQNTFSEARTADKAVLDITGDIEIRVDVWPHSWRPDKPMILASKAASAQISWVFYLTQAGTPAFIWSSAGTIGVTITGTAAVPASSGRLSLKVTFDVDNGAAGKTATFSTASTIGGSYTTLGSAVTTAGTTSIFSGTADLCIGTGSGTAEAFTGAMTYGGRFYEARVYNGIAGTLVADPIFANQTLGATSFSDGLGTPNTWAINNTARIVSDRQRFWGELSSLPQSWDTTGTDVWVNVQAAGMMRRLSQAGSPLRSPLYRQFVQYSNVTNYWPMEDSAGAETMASALSGGKAAQVSSVTFGADDSGMPAASSVLAFSSSAGQVIATPVAVSASGTLSFVIYFKLSAWPATQKTLITLYTTGTARRIEIGLDSANWHIDFYGSDGTNLSSTSTAGATISPVAQWIGLNLLLETSGANVSWSERWLPIGGGFLGIGPATFAGTVGTFTQFRLAGKSETAYADAKFSHMLSASSDIGFVTDTVLSASNAYSGETAAARVDRLGTEEGVATEVVGMWDDSAAMGYQTTDTLLNLLYACAAADLGMLGESRSKLALTYRTRGDLDAHRDGALDYSANVLSEVPLPTEDGLDLTNDVTVTRTGGSSARKVITSGSLSTQDPPNGVGTYATSTNVNAAADTQLPDIAGWLAHLGSWDESRYPNIKVSFNRSAEIVPGGTLAAQLMAMDLGDTMALNHLPAWLPPDEVLLLVQGYQETMWHSVWEVTANTTPGGPYRTGMYDYDNVPGFARYDTAGSTLNTGVNSSATTLILDYATTGDEWTTTSASYPFDIMMGGERITLTAAPGGSTSPQTFTGCTRSVNGVVKSHSAGEAVTLYDPTFYAIA